MGMTGFSDAEMALLSGLDAVAWVTRTRITYKDSFKREAIERYRRGESPVRIFREARVSTRASSATNASNGASPGGSANRRTPGRRARMPRRATPAGREDPRR